MRESSDNGWRELAGSIPVGIFSTDPAGSCDYVNNEWCRLTGFTEAEAMGAGWAGALHRDDRERVLASGRVRPRSNAISSSSTASSALTAR